MARHELEATVRYERSAVGTTDMINLLVVVARADGKINTAETEALVALIQTVLRKKLDHKTAATIVAEGASRLKELGADELLNQCGKKLANYGRLEDALGLAVDLAMASKGMSRFEALAIRLAAEAGGLSEERVDEILRTGEH